MDESDSDQLEQKIYVALPERWKDGKSILSWVLHHFSNNWKIIITHVHIPKIGTQFPVYESSPRQFNRKEELQKAAEWNRAERLLNEYLPQCSKAKFKAEILMFASHDVAHGLIELIALHGMSYLVMGTASDKWFSRMTEVKSKTAKIVMEKAHPSCKIWFVSKGNIVCIREPSPLSPQAGNQAASMPMERNVQNVPRKAIFDAPNLNAGEMIPRFPPRSPLQLSDMNSHNYFIDFSKGAMRTDTASSIGGEEGCSNYDQLSLNWDVDFETRPSHEPQLGSQVSIPAREQLFQGSISDVCARLQAALADATKYRVELNEETCKREKAERDLAFLIQQAEETKNVRLQEKQDVEMVKCQLQEENKKLQEERDNALKVIKALQSGAGHGSFVVFSKFSLLELQQATEDFSNSHKIGEGGFGCVYKGLLHSTMVAIKVLHPQILKDRPEFELEVSLSSTMRHPNLITLIGTCSEKSALVYELLPNGSLQDRLACQGGTPPLTWQVRTRIIGEICRALLFLHLNNPNPVVHGNLKPTNILLDSNLVCKLSDFGISHLLKSNTNTLVHADDNPREAFAYKDPECLKNGPITATSDVYSFGIIILQILTGKPPGNIIADVTNAIETNSLQFLIDKSAGNWPFIQAEQLAKLGLRCAQTDKRVRPDLGSEWKLVESLMNAASLSVLPSFKSELDDRRTPSYFMCPIFQEVMKDPHIAADGYTYEAEAIKGWIDSGHATSPMTNLPLLHLKLTPNHALRSAIQEWLLQRL